MNLGPFVDHPDHTRAAELDSGGLATKWGDQFVVTDPTMIYLDGNSLGRLPKQTSTTMCDVVERQWGDRVIRSWNEGWWDLQLEIGDLLAPVIGARPGEVIISDSTSVNLHKLALAALRARPGRTQIVTDDLNFPSDYYALESVCRSASPDHEITVVSSNGVDGPVDALRNAIGTNTALVTLSHTTYKSGYTYDLAEITSAAHDTGALVLWDMSHSAGVVADGLNAANVDLAVGCTYKYLNGGPGSPAFLYVRHDLHDEIVNPVQGWWGHADPFGFESDYSPTSGIRKYHTGTMPTLSLAATRPGIEMAAEAGIDEIRAASVSLMDFAEQLVDEHLTALGFEWASPRDPARRGSHASITHPNAWQICQSMIADANVIPDFRAPDVIRLGFAPLYTTHQDVHTAIIRIVEVVESARWQEYSPVLPGRVT